MTKLRDPSGPSRSSTSAPIARRSKRRLPVRSTAAVIGSVFFVVAGAGCSGSFEVGTGGPGGISGPSLERDIAERATELSDSRPESVDCPDRLDAEPGATTSCEMVHDGVRAQLAIEATSVSDDEERLDFSWQVVPGSQRLLSARVGDSIADAFFDETDLTLTDLTCPEPELAGTEGSVMTCAASTASGESGPVVLTVKGAEGMRVDFGWRLGESTPS